MRLIKKYLFKIGTKIPYSEWPDIAHRFLSDNGLTNHRFLYYFDDIPSESAESNACTRILKDCPELGEIQHQTSRYSDTVWLGNIGQSDSFPEERILPLMKKIHRRYGFSQCTLYYYDIDFFGKLIPYDRDYTVAHRICHSGIPFDPDRSINEQPYGSGITLQRDCCAQNFLTLSIDILHDGTVFDPTPYCESMQALLPGIKPSVSLKIYLNEVEKQQYEQINQAAAPILAQCRAFFQSRLPSAQFQNITESNYSIAKPLKKLTKQYGYTYQLVWSGGTYSIEKKTSRGNILYILVDSGPSHYDLNVDVTFQGVGFCHRLSYSKHTPTNQEETDACLERIRQTLSEFEHTMLPDLDHAFPESPAWFMASDLY